MSLRTVPTSLTHADHAMEPGPLPCLAWATSAIIANDRFAPEAAIP
jgi:hypothetical protein